MLFVRWNPIIAVSIAAVAAIPVLADPPPPTEWTPVAWANEEMERGSKIHRSQDAPLTSVGLEFLDAPLSEVADFLSNEYDIEVQLDHVALDDLGISPDEPISCNIRNISLRSALRLILRPLDLAAVESDEVLLITSEEQAATQMVVAVYPVGDILAAKVNDEGNVSSKHEPERIEMLIDVVISTVAPDSWVDNGGPDAEICPLQPGLLVVSQTQEVHRQIGQLLRALRVAKQHECAVPHRLPKSGEQLSDQEIEEAYRNGEQVQQGGGVF